MEAVQLRPEHEWLQRLVGEWTFEAVATAPDGAEHRITGTETVRSIGGVWIIGEATTQEPDGSTGHNLLTLGFDTERNRFVGTFVSSGMSHLWIYEGRLDAERRTLVLDTTGPSFDAPGAVAPYQDRIEITDADHRVMSSYGSSADGTWQSFMEMKYTRAAPASGG